MKSNFDFYKQSFLFYQRLVVRLKSIAFLILIHAL